MYGRVVRGNEASVKVLERNAFRFEREEFGAEDDPDGRGMLVYKKELNPAFWRREGAERT